MAFTETEIVQKKKTNGDTHVVDKNFHTIKWRIVSLYRLAYRGGYGYKYVGYV